MKKNFIILITNIILIYIFIFIFIYSKDLKENILFVIHIWLNNLIPSLFPFIILSNLLINNGFIDILSYLIGPIIERIYHLPRKTSIAILFSMLTGFPTGSKITKELLINKEINNEDANILITFTNYASPIFVISVIGENLLKNKKIGIFIYIIHIISGLLTGMLFRRKESNFICNNSIKNNKDKYVNIILKSIKDIFNLLFNILGIMIFFIIIITVLTKTFKDSLLLNIIKGLLEITTGITYLSSLNINFRIKIAIISFLISFSGLSIHLQTKSIIEDSDIKYKNYLYSRIIHASLCFFLTYFLYIFI